MVCIQPLSDYANQIVINRRNEAPHLLPEMMSMHYGNSLEAANKLPHLMVDQMAVCDYLKSGGIDPSRLAQTSPYGAGGPGLLSAPHRHSWMENCTRGSIVELPATEVDSAASSPGVQRVS